MKNETCAMVLSVMFVACLGAVFWVHGKSAEAAARHELEIVELEKQRKREVSGLQAFVRERVQAEEEAVVLSSPLAEFRESSGCGVRMDPMGGDDMGMHKGSDLVGPPGCDVLSAAPGEVVETWPPPDGYWQGHPFLGGAIYIYHGHGVFTLYGHLSEVDVRRGDVVRRGEPIGAQGDTGVSTGEHLHFEVIVDPMAALSGTLPRPGGLWTGQREKTDL